MKLQAKWQIRNTEDRKNVLSELKIIGVDRELIKDSRSAIAYTFPKKDFYVVKDFKNKPYYVVKVFESKSFGVKKSCSKVVCDRKGNPLRYLHKTNFGSYAFVLMPGAYGYLVEYHEGRSVSPSIVIKDISVGENGILEVSSSSYKKRTFFKQEHLKHFFPAASAAIQKMGSKSSASFFYKSDI